jgi:hypothetical protein
MRTAPDGLQAMAWTDMAATYVKRRDDATLHEEQRRVVAAGQTGH